jgi:hypothetical protein
MRKNTADWRNWRRFRGMGRAVFQWVSSHVPCGRRDRPACAAALGPPHRGTIFSLRSCLTIASSPSTSTPTRSRRGGCWERKGEAKAKAEETVTESATVTKRGPTQRPASDKAVSRATGAPSQRPSTRFANTAKRASATCRLKRVPRRPRGKAGRTVPIPDAVPRLPASSRQRNHGSSYGRCA